MAELNFGLLDANMPQKVANAFIPSPQEQMNHLALRKAMRDEQDDQTVRNAFIQSRGNPQATVDQLNNSGLGMQAMAVQSKLTEQQKSKLAYDIETLKVGEWGAAQVFANPTVENATNVLMKMQQVTGKDMSEDIAKVQTMTPEQLKQMAMGHGLEIKDMLPKLIAMNNGGENILIAQDPTTGQVIGSTSIAKTQSPDSIASNDRALQIANMNNAAKMKASGLDENGMPSGDIEKAAQAIAAYKIAPLSGFAMSKPMGQAVMGRVMQINPEYDAVIWSNRQASEKNFTSGQLGNTTRALNVAMNHMDTVEKLVNALQNNDVQLVNKIANFISKQTGDAAPTNLKAAGQILGKEVVKAIVAGGGGVAEREAVEKNFSNIQSPEQFKGVLNTYRELLGGQLSGLEQQYESGTSKKDFKKRFLNKAAANLPGQEGQNGGDKPTGQIKFLGFE
jgi:hypothetical protein